MSTTVKVARNTIIQTIALGIRTGVTIFIMFILLRNLGVDGYGNYLTIFTFISFFNSFLDLGISDIALREMSRNKVKAAILTGNVFILKLLISMIVLLLVSLTAQATQGRELIPGIMLASLSLPLTVIGAGTFGIIFKVYLRMEYQSVADILQNIVFLALVLAIGNPVEGLLRIILGYDISVLVGSLLVIHYSRKFVIPDFTINIALWKELLTSSFPLALAGIVGTIAYKIEILLLSSMKGAQSVGLYGVPFKLMDMVLMVAGFFAMSVYPIFSEKFGKKGENLEEFFQKAFRLSVAFGVVFTSFTFVFADAIVTFMYEGNIEGSRLSLKILSISIIFLWGNYILVYLLFSAGLQSKYLLISIIGLVTNLLLNLLLIPEYDYIGASIAKNATIMIETAGLIYFLSEEVKVVPVISCWVKAIISSLFASGITVYLVGEHNIVIQGIILIIALGVSLLTIKVISMNDIKHILMRKQFNHQESAR